MIKKFGNFQKIFEAWEDYDDYYEPDYWENDYEEDDTYHTYSTNTILTSFNVPKLENLGLLEYRDIVEMSLSWFEKQIASGSYGRDIIPPLDTIMDYIIRLIGNNYKEYISDENLDQLSRFIYQEIDNYIFD